MNAIGYIRVSTSDQADSGLSLSYQEKKIRSYADALDITLVNVISDAGYSAKSLNRPGMVEILKMVKAKLIDAVVILKLDRLTRSVKDLGTLIEVIEKNGIALMSVLDSINTNTANGRFCLNIVASISQWEREAIGERTAAAMQVKKATGQLVGSVPYGFDVATDGITLIENPMEQANLNLIRELRERGLSYGKIAQELNLRGIAAKKGGKWAAQTLCNICNKLLSQ